MSSIPFAQYNVLSSSLCEPTWYTESAAEDLDPRNRLPRVMAKLQEQIILSGGRVIIALQEVSIAWLGPLDIWFASRGYKLLCSLYLVRQPRLTGVSALSRVLRSAIHWFMNTAAHPSLTRAAWSSASRASAAGWTTAIAPGARRQRSAASSQRTTRASASVPPPQPWPAEHR